MGSEVIYQRKVMVSVTRGQHFACIKIMQRMGSGYFISGTSFPRSELGQGGLWLSSAPNSKCGLSITFLCFTTQSTFTTYPDDLGEFLLSLAIAIRSESLFVLSYMHTHDLHDFMIYFHTSYNSIYLLFCCESPKYY